ncbi:MAG: Fic family protein [Polyangiaceae bacterium]
MAWWFSDEAGPPDGGLLGPQNSLRLFDAAQALVDLVLRGEEKFLVGPSVICAMHKIAMAGLLGSAGSYRGDGSVKIFASGHVPPPRDEVPGLVEDMCSAIMNTYVGDPSWAASYALWRLNWIHPFEDGNGRTARVLAHMVLMIGFGMGSFPGVRRHLPDRIADEKAKYYRCLEECDKIFKSTRQVNVTNLQGFLERHLRGMLREANSG